MLDLYLIVVVNVDLAFKRTYILSGAFKCGHKDYDWIDAENQIEWEKKTACPRNVSAWIEK